MEPEHNLGQMLAPMITAQTVSQIRAGVSFSPGEIAGPIAGFAVLGLPAIWIAVSILGNVSDSATRPGEAPSGTAEPPAD